ncbi:MAG: class I SAM-dependent methyltransferase [Opitutaceae bacterium]
MNTLHVLSTTWLADREWLRPWLVQWPIALGPALFTSLLATLLRYRRSGMARIGEAMAVAFTLALSFSFIFPAIGNVGEWLEPWLYVPFTIYALAGIGLCAVGIHDRKRSAGWAMSGVFSLLAGAMTGFVPGGFAGFCVCFAIAWAHRATDPTEHLDVIEAAKVPNNRTRRARSLPRKLLREGQLHFLPIYPLATLSDLAREGIRNSGSYRFADHIYRAQPSGRGMLGRWIDKKFLELPATQAFHLRYKRAQAAMRATLESFPESESPLRILAIPCGLPRDFTELAATLARENPALLARIEYHGMDIDPELLGSAEDFTKNCGVPRRFFHRGNALSAEDYPRLGFHVVVSTGLGEFLETPELQIFYRNVQAVLVPGGAFYTSATGFEKRSEAFLRAFELITRYRTPAELQAILNQIRWNQLTLTQDHSGLQTFVIAMK